MQPTWIVRPSWLALHQRTLLGLVAMSAIGTLGFWYLDRKPPAPAKTIVQAVPSIVTVQVPAPAPPPPVVNVTVQPPEPIEPPDVATPAARALTPFLDANCIARTDALEIEGAGAATCAWDDGFPAISADGKTIALKYSNDDGGRGFLNVNVRFIDAQTSKVLSDHVIVAPEELDDVGQATDKTRALAAKRVAPIQKRLDSGHYRTMQRIEPTGIIAADEAPPAGMRVEHAQWESPVRVVDADTNTVLWRGAFDVAKEYPPKQIDPDTDTGCYPTNTSDVNAWFDPSTRIIAFEVSYGSAPCYCSSTVHHYARRAASP